MLKRTIILLALLFAVCTVAQAITPTISAQDVTGWQYGTSQPVTLRIYSNTSFFTQTGERIQAGTPSTAATGFFRSYTCTFPNSTTVRIPTITTLPTTTDAQDNANARYTAVFYQGTAKRDTYLSNFVLSHTLGSSLTWSRIAIFNAAYIPFTDTQTLNRSQISNMIASAVGAQNHASVGVAGVTELSAIPVDLNHPIAVGKNDPALLNVAQKPAAGSGICYSSTSGNDSNDGLSWGSSKLTILGCYDSLPSGGGTIYIGDGATVGGEVDKQGIWIMGAGDPNFASPPAGWRRQKGAVHFVGVGKSNQQFGVTTALIGTSFDYDDVNKPAVWLAGVTNVFTTFENLKINYPAVAVKIGIGSNGGRDVETALIRFVHCSLGIYNVGTLSSTKGPVVDIGAAFWVYFEKCAISAYAPATVTEDRRAGILVKSSSISDSLYVSDCVFAAGGIKFYNALTVWDLTVRDVTIEGDNVIAVAPAVWILNANRYGFAFLSNIVSADSGAGSMNTVKIEGDNPPAESVTVINSTGVSGPATVLSQYPSNWDIATQTPAGQRQVGFWKDRISGQHDSARRSFGLVAARFPNLVHQSPVEWAASPGGAVVTQNVSAPDGTLGAARLSGGDSRNIYRDTLAMGVGDYIVAGIWVRAASSAGAKATVVPFIVFNSGSGVYAFDGVAQIEPPLKGDGEWEWIYTVLKLTSVPSVTGELIMNIWCDSTHPLDWYAPTLLRIPAASISDNEAKELAQHVSSQPFGVTPGTVSLLRGQSLRLSSSAVSPTQLTADVDNYTLSGQGFFLRLSSDASRTITGINAGTATGIVDGTTLTMWNIGAQNIVLANEGASSTAANRFKTSTGADLTIPANKCALVTYDAVTLRWRATLLP